MTTLIGLLALLLVAAGAFRLHGSATSNAALKASYEDQTVPVGQLGDIELMLRIENSVLPDYLWAV